MVDNNNFAVMALVAIVAVVGVVSMVVLMNGGSTKEVMVSSNGYDGVIENYEVDENVAGQGYAVPLNEDGSLWLIGGRTYAVRYGQDGPEGLVLVQ